jgi:hypothetical protein
MKKHNVRYAEGKPRRPEPSSKKREKQIADTLTAEAQKKGFKWRV